MSFVYPFIFSTAGINIPFINHRKLRSALRKKGFEIVGEFSCRGWDTNGWLEKIGGINKGHPNEKDLENAKRGYRVTGIDISQKMLEKAKEWAQKKDVEVELIKADAARFECNEEFDAAICLCEGAFSLVGLSDDPIEHDLRASPYYTLFMAFFTSFSAFFISPSAFSFV